MTDQQPAPLGWWTISGEALLNALRRVQRGEAPDAVYAELYVNSDHEPVQPNEPDVNLGSVVLRLRGYASGDVRIETSYLTRQDTVGVLTRAIGEVQAYPGEWTTEQRDLT